MIEKNSKAKYTENNILRLAKRWQNARRSYLLVNPWQAKHLPASPAVALQMMTELGRQTAAHYPKARLVIGFAETATAIGAALAGCLPPDCVYVQTTRESAPENCLVFQEEHSHAVEQKLCVDLLPAAIERSEQIVFVDDEISTGQTLLNIIAQLKQAFPACQSRELAAASIINRLSAENERRWAEVCLRAEYLLRPKNQDYENLVAGWQVGRAEPAETASGAALPDYRELWPETPYLNPRFGVQIGEYQQNCWRNARQLAAELTESIAPGSRVLLLGTEEFMYPALVLGAELEQQGRFGEVCCHATTRSPIGVGTAEEYPIRSGWQLPSFYDTERQTFIYNLAAYDAAVVMSDTPSAAAETKALAALLPVLQAQGCRQLFYIRGGHNVQHL